MKIELTKAGKRYNREWIFRNFSYQFTSGNTYAITGPNGSGKSTLLQSIAGMLQLNEGSMLYSGSSSIDTEQFYKNVSFAAPYLELIEEMTFNEFLQFHTSFKPFIPTVSTSECTQLLDLQDAADKQIRFYSSGMKQRVRLAQAIFSDTPAVLLDEPCSNLDVAGIELYHRLVQGYCHNRILIISSNDPVEYESATAVVNVGDYKNLLI